MPKLEYKILESEGNNARTTLEVLVNRSIAEGWEPQGGISVSDADISGTSFTTYLQAMIRSVP